MTGIPHIARNRIVLAIAVLAVLVLLLLYIPIRIPASVPVYGRLLPAKEWVLLRGAGGQLVSLLRCNATGAVEEYAVTEPERGDAMQFVLARGVAAQGSVRLGDTLCHVISPELARQLTALEGSLGVASAGLASARSGEKPALVRQAQAGLEQATAAFDEQRRLHARQEELHKKKIISDEEIEISGDRLAVLRAGVAVAEAQLAAMRSGLKAEDVRQHEETVAALEAEIMQLRQRLARFTYTAPITGVLRAAQAGDTLIALQDAANLVLLLPLPVDEHARLTEESDIVFDVPRTGMQGRARLLRVDAGVRYLGGAPVLLAVAEVHDGASLRPGLIAHATVSFRSLTLREYFSRMWTSLFH